MGDNDIHANVKAIREERALKYGDATFGHGNLGLMWTGLLQNHYGIKLDHPLPPEMVLVMMAVGKANRVAVEKVYDPDHFEDGMNYFQLAGEAKQGKPDSATSKLKADFTRELPPLEGTGSRED